MCILNQPSEKVNRSTPEQAFFVAADVAMRCEIKAALGVEGNPGPLRRYLESLRLVEGGDLDLSQIAELCETCNLLGRVASNLAKAALRADHASRRTVDGVPLLAEFRAQKAVPHD